MTSVEESRVDDLGTTIGTTSPAIDSVDGPSSLHIIDREIGRSSGQATHQLEGGLRSGSGGGFGRNASDAVALGPGASQARKASLTPEAAVSAVGVEGITVGAESAAGVERSRAQQVRQARRESLGGLGAAGCGCQEPAKGFGDLTQSAVRIFDVAPAALLSLQLLKPRPTTSLAARQTAQLIGTAPVTLAVQATRPPPATFTSVQEGHTLPRAPHHALHSDQSLPRHTAIPAVEKQPIRLDPSAKGQQTPTKRYL